MRLLGLWAFTIVLVYGCTASTDTQTNPTPDSAVNPNPNPNPNPACDDPATCNYDSNCPPFVDPSGFTACANDAHCIPKALITDPAQAMQLAACPGSETDVCVPDL